MTNHEELLARLDAWLGTGDSDTADFLHDMRDAAALIRELASQLPEGMTVAVVGVLSDGTKGITWLDNRHLKEGDKLYAKCAPAAVIDKS